jgi:hypothetical protein
MRQLPIAIVLFLLSAPALGAPPKGPLGTATCFDLEHVPELAGVATYYVRADGGNPEQCDGKRNAPYPGKGAGQACAWSHPFYALPPVGGTPRIRGGDRLVIGPGQYRMGYGAPGAEACEKDGSFDCFMAALPSGPDRAHPTRLTGTLGPGGSLTQLWGAERAFMIVNLRSSKRAEVSCLEITDHSQCVEFHSGRLTCQRDRPPYGDWAASGITAVDSSDVVLRSLDVHGLASAGIVAGRVADYLVEDVFITANGIVGWQGDLGEPSSDSGAITFRRVTIDWNGCGETTDTRQPTGCWSQEAGGYGDGLGTGATGGEWRFEDVKFLFNTSDGLDLLYHDGRGKVTIDRVWAEGNAGNQLKVRGEVLIQNAVAIGNCAFFKGKPFSFHVDDCRAAGNTIALEPIPGRPQTIASSTITTDGNSLLEDVLPVPEPGDKLRAGLPKDACRKLAPLRIVDTIWLGGTFVMNGEPTALFYKECGGIEGAGPAIDDSWSIVWKVKDYGLPEEGACPPATHNLCVDPKLDPATLRPQRGSPAIDSGAALPGVPATDYLGRLRPAGKSVDRGAYEQ